MDMLCDILTISNEDAFLILINIRFISLFLLYNNTDNTTKYSEMADILFFLYLVFFWY